MLLPVTLVVFMSFGRPGVVVEAFETEKQCKRALLNVVINLKEAKVIPNDYTDLMGNVFHLGNGNRIECVKRT
jgi:hypothetical protein